MRLKVHAVIDIWIFQIVDTKGQTFVHREDTSKSRFSFTTDSYEVFEICFTSHASAGHLGADREITLNMKHGVEAKNYDAVSNSD